MQDGCKYRDNAIFLSVQIKEKAKKHVSTGTCYPLPWGYLDEEIGGVAGFRLK